MKILFPAILVLCLWTGAIAQNSDTARFAGKKALTFTFSGFNLGGGFGGRYCLNDNQFVKLQIYGSYASNKSDRFLVDSSSIISEGNHKNFGFNVGIATRFEITNNIAPYYGLNVGYMWSLDHQTVTSLRYISNWDDASEGFSAGLFLGVEYFVVPRFSISGEQTINALWSKSNDGDSMFNLGNSTSSILLTIYF